MTKQRGVPVESDLAPYVVATVHPSLILRQETEEDRAEAMKELVDDLKKVRELLAAPPPR